jgi:hypothetical protein
MNECMNDWRREGGQAREDFFFVQLNKHCLCHQFRSYTIDAVALLCHFTQAAVDLIKRKRKAVSVAVPLALC